METTEKTALQWWALLGALAFFFTVLLTGCAGPAVQVVAFEGEGEFRTDGDAMLVTGEVDGWSRVFAKGTGYPLYYFPFLAGDGFVWVGQLSTNTFELVAEDELPEWAEVLLDPDQEE